MKHILITMMQGIGDAVNVLPLISHLKVVLPEVKLHIAHIPGYEVLLEQVNIDFLYPVYSMQELSNKIESVSEFDIVFDTAVQVNEKGYVDSLNKINHKLTIGFRREQEFVASKSFTLRVDFSRQNPVWRQILELRKYIDTTTAINQPSLPLLPNNADVARQFLKKLCPSFNYSKPIVCLCVGGFSRREKKRWPIHSYKALADWISQCYNANIIVLGDEEEESDGELIVMDFPSKEGNLSGKTSLRDAIYIIGISDLVISNDTGLMHIAGALDRPIIALYYGTTEIAYQPMNGNFTAIVSATNSISDINVGDVASICISYLQEMKVSLPEELQQRIVLVGSRA
jgi:heptosyltransferase II